MARADLHVRLGVVRRRAAHALLDLARHGKESLLDVAGVLGRGLEEGDSQAVGEFLCAMSQRVVPSHICIDRVIGGNGSLLLS